MKAMPHPPEAPMTPRPARVVSLHRETADTVTIALEPVDGAPLTFRPGQFDMLYAFGVGEIPISFSGARNGSVLHTVRAVGAVSRAICATQPGGMLGVRGPFGAGWGIEDVAGADIVIVGGGIGLAPLRPVVHAIIAERERYGRVSVLVGARSPDLLLFGDELREWRARFDLEVEVTVDVAGADWRGDVGLVTALLDRAPFDASSTVAMVCGPEIMMRFVANGLLDRGVPASNVRISMERNMKCAIGHCGHCQLGPAFVCKDGPVFTWDRMAPLLAVREV